MYWRVGQPKADHPRDDRTVMYYVYILYSNKLDKLYTGYTTDLKQRFAHHNKGFSTYTKMGVPWKLIYYECFTNGTDARREEIFLKSGKGKDRVEYLLQHTLESGQDGNARVSKTRERKL